MGAAIKNVFNEFIGILDTAQKRFNELEDSRQKL